MSNDMGLDRPSATIEVLMTLPQMAFERSSIGFVRAAKVVGLFETAVESSGQMGEVVFDVLDPGLGLVSIRGARIPSSEHHTHCIPSS
jgi:hypothetical protein